jgi:hypothetical protein
MPGTVAGTEALWGPLFTESHPKQQATAPPDASTSC